MLELSARQGPLTASLPVPHRLPRVRFAHPVRVTPLGGPPRAYRVMAANLSNTGMFLNMPTPLDEGMQVALSLEAGGRVLPFAQGEVVWRRLEESQLTGRRPGFGVKFTGFLHPRAKQLVEYLCGTLGTGRPLKAASPERTRKLVRAFMASAALSFALGGLAIGWPHLGSAARSTVAEATPAAVTPAEPLPPVEPPAPSVEAMPAAAPTNSVEVAAPVEDAPAAAAEAGPAPEPDVEPLAPLTAPASSATPSPSSPMAVVKLSMGAARELRWRTEGAGLEVQLGTVAKGHVSNVFLLASPARLVFDVEGARPKRSGKVTVDTAHMGHVRVGARAASTRVVVDLDRAPTSLQVRDNLAQLSFE